VIETLIVPVLTKYELLYRMLKSIDYPIENIVIINNGDGIIDLPDMSGNVHLIDLPHNIGVAASWNLGIKVTPLSRNWLIANFDVMFPEGALAKLAKVASEKKIVFGDCWPEWSCFVVGWQVIDRIGFFDENCHPAYCEDNIAAFRARANGIELEQSHVRVHHDNSSSIADTRYAEQNKNTFDFNVAYAQQVIDSGDPKPVPIKLSRLRNQAWT
jgi:GT2 family glycosyltransferase